jgi:hypothetical protein
VFVVKYAAMCGVGNSARFIRKHGDLVERLPKKELAAYLNLSPETLSRLKQRGKISV